MRFCEQTAILHVENDAVDVEILRRGLRAAGIFNRLIVACDGAEALARLEGDPAIDVSSLVAVVDLHMPGMSGLEFLARVRATPRLRELAVYVLTTSEDEADVAEARRHRADGYLLKPRVGGEARELARRLHALWQASGAAADTIGRRAS